MAIQKGVIKLKGTLGDITFRQTKYGYTASDKSSLDGARVKNDPDFERTRENMSEFGRAGKAVKLIRSAFHNELRIAKDDQLTPRMLRAMMKVLKGDAAALRGGRTPEKGDLVLLKHFDFNSEAGLATTSAVPYTAAFDRAEGKAKIDIPSFLPKQKIVIPGGATHFKFFCAAAELDFAEQDFIVQAKETPVLPWNMLPTADYSLPVNLTPNSDKPVIVILGICFSQWVNGVEYPLNNSGFNSMSMVLIDKP